MRTLQPMMPPLTLCTISTTSKPHVHPPDCLMERLAGARNRSTQSGHCTPHSVPHTHSLHSACANPCALTCVPAGCKHALWHLLGMLFACSSSPRPDDKRPNNKQKHPCKGVSKTGLPGHLVPGDLSNCDSAPCNLGASTCQLRLLKPPHALHTAPARVPEVSPTSNLPQQHQVEVLTATAPMLKGWRQCRPASTCVFR